MRKVVDRINAWFDPPLDTPFMQDMLRPLAIFAFILLVCAVGAIVLTSFFSGGPCPSGLVEVWEGQILKGCVQP
jgi:hypothetical protein